MIQREEYKAIDVFIGNEELEKQWRIYD